MDTNKKEHKRFLAFVVTSILVTLGFFIGPAAAFEMFAKTLGFIYAGYLGGQSVTDHRAITVNGAKP